MGQKVDRTVDDILHDLHKAVDNGENCSVFGLSFGEKAIFLSTQKRQVMYVCQSLEDGKKFATQAQSFGKTVKTIFFKQTDLILGSNTFGENVAQGIDAIFSLAQGKVDVLVVSPEVLLQKFPDAREYRSAITKLKVGEKIDRNVLIEKLAKSGYKRADVVTMAGEFSVHGETIDIFSSSENLPCRIDFFDTQIERISQISVEDCKRVAEKNSIEIVPNFLFAFQNSKQLFDEVQADFERTQKKLDANQAVILKSNFEEFKLNFQNGNMAYCQNWLLPFLPQNSIANFLRDDALIVFDDVKQIYNSVLASANAFLALYDSVANSGNILLSAKNYDLSFDRVFALNRQMLSFQQITNANKIFQPTSVLSYRTSAVTNYFGNFDLLLQDIKYYRQFDNDVVIFCKTKQNAMYLQKFLNANDIPTTICDSISIDNQNVTLVTKDIPFGAVFVEDKVVFVGSRELYKKEAQKKIESQNKKEEFVLPKVGDYVVHEKFGIGVCIGIEKLRFADYQKDYIILQYDHGDKLYLPTEQVGLISAYVGNGNSAPKLNHLGTNDFEKTKQKVKSSLKKLAFDLVKLYGEREHAKGFRFEIDEKMFEQFENSFPFDETPDQISAIKDIKNDMLSGRVMDRLICGDVGYGKTEVALRAAFISAINGKQVAFLAPTTILSQQHFGTAQQRLKDFGIVVECLNRFKTKAEQKEIVQRLKDGQIDVICGTHRLLSNDVAFKDLGLLILDEEQRFGVGDKEKIKNLKKNVDVLTLSATPIPRTLHMSLSGIRDISLLTTAPQGRLPVQTTVTEYSDVLVLQAIKRELSRGGQVLIIYNRVESIFAFASHIKSLLTEQVSVGVAHGQMEQEELEKQIFDLYSGKTQILVSTTLIENGVDLPNANTLIVTNADSLGLSQLYQLKGRVGRSKNLGYAYFLYDHSKQLSSDAYKRLNALMEFTELGSGFKIAMRDLEIRGCGNILGPEQSGHMAKIGYDLYCKILNEAVAEARGQKQRESKEIKLDVATNCFVPEDYIQNSDDRFKVYINLKKVDSLDKQKQVLDDLNDKFGAVPTEVVNLSFVAMLKNIAQDFDAKFVKIDREKCLVEFYDKESMLQKDIATALKQSGVKVYFSQTGAVMNFMLSEYSVKRKLEIVSQVFERAQKLKNSKDKNLQNKNSV